MYSESNVHNVDYKDIGIRIRECRNHRGFSQEQLAELSNISVHHLSNIENASTKLSLPTIISLANSVSVTVDCLLVGNVEASKPTLENELVDLFSACSSDELKILKKFVKQYKLEDRK